MNKAIGALVVAALWGGTLGAQESAAPPEGLVQEAMRKLAEGGPCVVKGRYARDGSMMDAVGGLVGGGGGTTLTGEFTAKVGKNRTVALLLEGEEGKLELYAQGSKRAHRLTWGSSRPPSVANVSEVLIFLDFKKLSERLKDPKATSKGDKDVDGAACWVLSAVLPKETLDAGGSDSPAAAAAAMMNEVKQVEARFYIGKQDRLLKRLEVRVTRGFSEMIQAFLPGGQQEDGEKPKKDEKKDKKPAVELPPGVDAEQVKGVIDAMKTVDTYTLKVEKFDAALTVEIPKDLAPLMEE